MMWRPASAFVFSAIVTILLGAGSACSRRKPIGAPPAVDTAANTPTMPAAPWESDAQELAVIKAKPPNSWSDADKLKLIELLNKDLDMAAHPAVAGGGEDEAFGGYLIELSLAVAGLHDKRAISALVKVMDVSQSIDTAIAEFGDDAVAPVIEQLGEPDQRPSVADELGYLLKGKRLNKNSLSPAAVDRIQATLLNLTSDPVPLVRRIAVRSLAFGTPTTEIVNAVKKLSTEDPTERIKTRAGEKKTVYPVRDQAIATLNAWAAE